MGYVVKIQNPQKTANRLCKDRELGLFMTNLYAKEMEPYVPMDTGALKDSWKKRVEPFRVNYNTTYAKILHSGIRNGKKIHFNREKHSLAKAKWDELPKYRLNNIAKQVERYIRAK